MKLEFAVDRGGTFTDVFCLITHQDGSKSIKTMKLLSEDPHYDDAISEGVRRLLSEATGTKIEGLIPTSQIKALRVGTTLGTNALLERKGAKTALFVTEGFENILEIGNQARPKIFDLNIKKNLPLYSKVIEVDERVLVASTEELLADPTIPKFQMEKSVELDVIKSQLEQLKEEGFVSIAISLMNAFLLPENELKIEKLAKEVGFSFISVSHKISERIGYLSRTSTTLLDAYLNPILRKYLDRLKGKFESQDFPIYFMQSDGVIVEGERFTGCASILSGPAGGVTGFSKTSQSSRYCYNKVIGFDMGGTSTDVSIYEGKFDLNFEAEIADTFITMPHLDINTVAAGGGSRLFYRNNMCEVGPESAGSHPGPVCYGKDGYLSITDCNLALGRIIPEYFPKIFGPGQDEPLYQQDSKKSMQLFKSELDTKDEQISKMSDSESVYGFIKVANEAMCRPIRVLTEGKGKNPKEYSMAVFGGAGSQHACGVSNLLGIKRIFVHKYSSILSAFGIFLADISEKEFIYIAQPLKNLLKDETLSLITDRLSTSVNKIRDLKGAGSGAVAKVVSFVLHYEGSAGRITITNEVADSPKFEEHLISEEFKRRHKEEFGFSIELKEVILETIFCEAKLCRSDIDEVLKIGNSSSATETISEITTSLPFSNPSTGQLEFMETKTYDHTKIKRGEEIEGPALIVINGSTIVVEPSWNCIKNEEDNFELQFKEPLASDLDTENVVEVVKDPIMLSIFGQRFMAIAEQMGRLLQRTAISLNIKERLDFSCAVFGPDGSLVANAPHLPVHLGSMEDTVKYQIEHHIDEIEEGDVIITNHPGAGGSHLPDVTAITPCFFNGKPIFYVASRGHHSDIGGITPGSMPAFSKFLIEEGVPIKSFFAIKRGVFREDELKDLLLHPPGGIGCRAVENNIGDIKAQASANNKGIQLLLSLVSEYKLSIVHGYMRFIQEAAEQSVR